MSENSKFMRKAIEMSFKGMRAGMGGPFGAVVVKDGAIIAAAHNCVMAHNDPTAHAEVVAIREACKVLGSFQLTGCEIYTSCEPCPMCLGAIYWARPDKVYYANTRTDAAEIGFDDQLIYDEIAVDMAQRRIDFLPLLREEAMLAFEEWQHKGDRVDY